MRRLIIIALVATGWLTSFAMEYASACVLGSCAEPEVSTGSGALTAAYVVESHGGGFVATSGAPVDHPYTEVFSTDSRGERLVEAERAGGRLGGRVAA